MDYKESAAEDRKKAEELLKIAELKEWVADGGQIEIFSPMSEYGWLACVNVEFVHTSDNYRKVEKPEYTPFEWEDRDDLMGKTVVAKDGKHKFTINDLKLYDDCGFSVNHYKSKYLFDNYIFKDGSIFGKVKK